MFLGGRDLVLRSSELATLAALFSFRYYAGLASLFIWHSTSEENASSTKQERNSVEKPITPLADTEM
jgi:hypothetical protein